MTLSSVEEMTPYHFPTFFTYNFNDKPGGERDGGHLPLVTIILGRERGGGGH